MKKFIYIVALIFALPAFNSCEKHDLSFYEGEDAIYFDQQWGVAHFDSLRQTRQYYSEVTFGDMEKSDSLLRIKVETMGNVYDYDRPFSYEIVADSTTAINGEDYEIITTNPVILAGQNSTYISIMFHKTERMDSVNLQLQLRLIPGEHFILPFDKDGFGKMPLRKEGGDQKTKYGTNADPSVHSVFINNFLSQPERWNANNMGVWSELKMKTMLELVEPLGWTVSTFNSEKMWYQGGYNTCVTQMAKYLLERYKMGREYWMVDPDGTMMWVNSPTIPWTENTKPEEMVDM